MDAKNKNLLTKFVIVIIFVVLLTTIGNFFYSYDINDIYIESYVNKDIQKKQYTLEDCILSDYNIAGDRIVSNTDDGKIIIDDINFYILDVKVKLLEKCESDCEVKVYYAVEDGIFSEEYSVSKVFRAEKKKIKIPINARANSVRIDLGNQIGQEFVIDKIVVQGASREFSVRKFIKNIVQKCCKRIFIIRWIFIFPVILFLAIHFIIDIKKLYNCIFKYRWLIGGVFVLICTIFKIHGDSMSMYDDYVQSGQGSEFVQPLFGQPRAIRSDEWVVDTPAALAASYGTDQYGKYNAIFRGGHTLNMIDGIRITYSTVARNPSWLIYKILDEQRAFCFCWNFRIIFTLLITIELFYIITRRNKVYSVVGGVLVVCSPFYLWWNFPLFIAGISSAIVCICYFLIARDKRKKLLYAIGVALSTANFVVNFYPAWQVPTAYIVLAFLIWIIHVYWRWIKCMDKIDWIIFFGALILCITLIGSYLYEIQEYLIAIADTVYPGKRRDAGGFRLEKIMYYGQALLFAFKEPENSSNSSAFFSLFPLPMIIAFFSFWRSKKRDWLIGGLLCVAFFLLIYCTIGLPEYIAKIMLIDFSTPNRAIDILGYVNVILLIICLGRRKVKSHCNRRMAVGLGVALSVIVLYVCAKDTPGYFSLVMLVFSGVIVFTSVFALVGKMSEMVRKQIWMGITYVLIGVALPIRPIMLGFDAYYSKPLANAVQDIVQNDENGVWIANTGGIAVQSYIAACGAPTLNTVNYYPNMEMWEILDAEGKYNDIYNRYCHVNVCLVDDSTTMELVSEDLISVYLSYNDLERLGIDYILSQKELPSIDNVSFDKLYDEYGMYIYKVNY